jgi:hypothetical protein
VIGDTQLLEIVGTTHSPGRFTRSLHSRQKQRYQYSDDGDHDEQFDKRKSAGRDLPSFSQWNHPIPLLMPRMNNRKKTKNQTLRRRIGQQPPQFNPFAKKNPRTGISAHFQTSRWIVARIYQSANVYRLCLRPS